MNQLAPGDEFAGHRIEAVIGAGGMGVVYRAVHLGLERAVALKLIAPGRDGDGAWRERFRRESRLAAALEHPAILAVYDAGEYGGVPYVTMRLVAGGDLGRRLAGQGPLAPAAAVELVEQLASALDAAHVRGLVHRDVKPANVLLEPPRAFLADFGLARALHDSAGPTATGRWVGSVDYAAPEQISEGRADARSDVYALAGVLYAALSARPPFERGDPAAVMWAHVHDQPPTLEDERLRAFDDVVAKGMGKDAEERFQSAGELATAARAALEPPGAETGRIAAASASGATAAPALRRRRRRAGWIAVGVAAVLAAALALVFVVRDGDSRALEAPLTVGQIELPGAPVDVAIAGGAVWVALRRGDDGAGAIVALEDAGAAEPTPLAGRPIAFAAGEGALWALLQTSLTSFRLQQLDARTGRPAGVRINLDASLDGQLAVTPGAVWISVPGEDTLLRIDPETSRLEPPIEIPAGVDGPLAVGEGALWVLSRDPQVAVTPVDPRSGAVGRAIRVADPSAIARESLAVGGGSVWVADPETGVVRRVDARRRRLTPTSLTLEAGVAALAYGDGALWALAGDGELVRRIDPRRAALRGHPVRVDVARDARLAVGAGAAWVTDAPGASLVRLGY